MEIVGLMPRRPRRRLESRQTIVLLFMGLFVSGWSVLVTPSPLREQSKHACVLHQGSTLFKSLAGITVRAGLGSVLSFCVTSMDGSFSW